LLGLKVRDPLLIYMHKVILKFQLWKSLGVKDEIGRPISQFGLIKLTSRMGLAKTTFDSSIGWG
jgi:hypothetical protein